MVSFSRELYQQLGQAEQREQKIAWLFDQLKQAEIVVNQLVNATQVQSRKIKEQRALLRQQIEHIAIMGKVIKQLRGDRESWE